MMRCIVFAVGDTAGHVTPALAIAEAYDAAGVPVDVRLIAAPGGSAALLAARSGRPLSMIEASPLARAGVVARSRAVAHVFPGIGAARRLLRQAKARLVIGTGGYASGAVLLAARSLGLATAIVEPNVEPGLANRLLRHVVDRVYTGWDETARHFPHVKTVVTGVPVSPGVAARLDGPKDAPAAFEPIHVLVTGASRGEDFLGREMPAFLDAVQRLGVVLTVRHQSGALDSESLGAEYGGRGVRATVTPFLDDMAEALRWAHFVVTRAGAATLGEIAIAGVPALVVPLSDAAADHQSANAERHAAAGAALWSRERSWDRSRLAEQLHAIVTRQERWVAMSEAARRRGRPDAARRILDDCERLMSGQW